MPPRSVAGIGTTTNGLVLGRVMHFHIADDVYDNGKVHAERLRPIARLGGRKYARLADILTMPAAELPRRSAKTKGDCLG